jgi:hypothetical protein
MDEPKRCVACGEVKPLEEFAVHRKFKDGRQSRCDPCAEVMRRKRAYRPGTADFRQRTATRRRQQIRLKLAVFDHYGWACACCGRETKKPEIDHIDGKGREHRMELFGTPNGGGPRFWAWLVRNDFPEGFQTLCGRCNRAKGATDTCPLHPSAPRAA